MAKPVIWQDKAVEQFETIQDYLIEEWGENSAIRFTQKVFQSIYLISRFPYLGTSEFPERNIRGYIVSDQVQLLYQVERGFIYLLAFFDTRQDPSGKQEI